MVAGYLPTVSSTASLVSHYISTISLNFSLAVAQVPNISWLLLSLSQPSDLPLAVSQLFMEYKSKYTIS